MFYIHTQADRQKLYKIYATFIVSGNGSWIPEPTSHLSAIYQYESEKKNLWLFNIAEDPTEHKDLSNKYPDIVKTMLDMLQGFNHTSIPCYYPKEDKRGNPELLGGYWGPWM